MGDGQTDNNEHRQKANAIMATMATISIGWFSC